MQNQLLFISGQTPNLKFYQKHFKQRGMVNITHCFHDSIIQPMTAEAFKVFYGKSKRKDFISQHTSTPRNMFTVSEADIATHSQLITDFYYSQEVLRLLSEIAQEKIDFLPWMGERFVINGLMNNDDTHGWHWDDYAYALVFIADCPPKHAGGEVEFVPHTQWNKAQPNISQILERKNVQTQYFAPGTFYFMRSDTTLHRVAKISHPYKRLSIAMSYCNQADLSKQMDHQTVIDLYG